MVLRCLDPGLDPWIHGSRVDHSKIKAVWTSIYCVHLINNIKLIIIIINYHKSIIALELSKIGVDG